MGMHHSGVLQLPETVFPAGRLWVSFGESCCNNDENFKYYSCDEKRDEKKGIVPHPRMVSGEFCWFEQ